MRGAFRSRRTWSREDNKVAVGLSQSRRRSGDGGVYIVTDRLWFVRASAAYVSGHLKYDAVPACVSLGLVAKASAKIERIAGEVLPVP